MLPGARIAEHLSERSEAAEGSVAMSGVQQGLTAPDQLGKILIEPATTGTALSLMRDQNLH
jgi:hypothetical protein